MRARLESWWFGLGQSLWFLPAVLTGSAAVLSLITVYLDQRLLGDERVEIGWLFGGGTEGARGVLQAIAGTMITVTGLVFSITIVALQLAASQLTPRVLHTFMSDRLNQTVMGSFIATFTYALLVLRVVRSPLEDRGGFVPSLSVTVAIGFALVSVGLLIAFVHHAANAMRAAVVIDRAANATTALIERLASTDEARRDTSDQARPSAAPAPAASVVSLVRATDSGYLQTINTVALVTVADQQGAIIHGVPLVGEFILPGTTLAAVRGVDADDDELAGKIRAAFVLGPERTLQADVALGLQQLSDIAIKALSPGINDPTTATICIDRLSEVLVLLGRGGERDGVHRGDGGELRVVLPQPSFASLAGVAFDQIRHYGAADPALAVHLVTALGRLAHLVAAQHRPAIVQQAMLVLEAMRPQIAVDADRERVERAAAWLATVRGKRSAS